MSYEEWAQAVPEEIKADVLWRLELYRMSLFLSDLSWHDASKLM